MAELYNEKVIGKEKIQYCTPCLSDDCKNCQGLIKNIMYKLIYCLCECEEEEQ